jgi:hypothetical protein
MLVFSISLYISSAGAVATIFHPVSGTVEKAAIFKTPSSSLYLTYPVSLTNISLLNIVIAS